MRVAARSGRDFVARLAKDPAITFGTRRVARNLARNAAHERQLEVPISHPKSKGHCRWPSSQAG